MLLEFFHERNCIQIRFSGSKLNKVLQWSNFKKFNEIDFYYLNFVNWQGCISLSLSCILLSENYTGWHSHSQESIFTTLFVTWIMRTCHTCWFNWYYTYFIWVFLALILYFSIMWRLRAIRRSNPIRKLLNFSSSIINALLPSALSAK